MKPYHKTDIGLFYQGDCRDVMPRLQYKNYHVIDAIVVDPPYGISFMGKKWDYEIPSVEIWKAAFDILKPGGYLLSFAGTRTQHRMVCNIEDAGFEIRDMIAWVYGSGFPKSLNIGKAVDKMQGNARIDLGLSESSRLNAKRHDVIVAISPHSYTGEVRITKGTSPYEGWGTALKPAFEPITVARKPLDEKTVAANVLKWGTGGINIDGCRVGLDGEKPPTGSAKRVYKSNQYTDEKIYGDNKVTPPQGRFPANFIHDGSNEVLELFPDTKSGKPGVMRKCKNDSSAYAAESRKPGTLMTGPGDSGSAARFFYCAKASKAERGPGNNHPTVKPIKLIKYLVNLVTPPGGIVLDFNSGSGTMALACESLGVRWVCIEKEIEHCETTVQRLNGLDTVDGLR